MKVSNTVDRLWKYTKSGKKRIYKALIILCASSVILASIPILLGKIVDVITDYVGGTWNRDGVIMDTLPYIIAIILIFVTWYLLNSHSKAIITDDASSRLIRDDLARKVDRMSTEDIESRPSGELTTLIVNDIPNIIKILINDIPCFFEQIAILITVLILMFFTVWQLALVYAVLVVFSYMVTRLIGRRNLSDIEERQRSMGELNGLLNDTLSNHSLIKLYNLEDRFSERFRRINRVNSKSYVRTYRASGFVQPIGRIIDNIGYIIVAIIGASMVTSGHLSNGAFIAFVSLATLTGKPLIELSDCINRLQNEFVSAERLFSILDEREVRPDCEYDHIDTDSSKGRVEFRNVHYQYPNGTKAINGLSFTLEPGTVTAIVGVNGSGRNTTSDLIMNYRSPSEGQILLDGKDITTIQRNDLWKVIGISPQSPWIVRGTVLDNLSYGRPDASRIEMIQMAKKTGYDYMVRGYPKVYDTVVGKNKYHISSGESQVMSFTRLAVYDPKVVILNESVTDLDPISLHEFSKNYIELLKGRTAMIISNNEKLLRRADRVIYLDHGAAADIGTHEELIERNPGYRSIFRE